MKILYRSRKIQKTCTQKAVMVREYGPQVAEVLGRRLAELEAADTLADMAHFPAVRFHELSGKRKGQFAVDLRHPLRLVFGPASQPVPRRADGGMDTHRVTEILELEIVDYH